MPIKAGAITGSDLEVKVYTWLIKRGFRLNVDFEFQSHLIGGYNRELGDAIVDFVLLKEKIAWRVQGEYWHTSVQEKARDTIQKERLRGLGYTVVDIWETDINERFEYTMQQAIRGVEIGS